MNEVLYDTSISLDKVFFVFEFVKCLCIGAPSKDVAQRFVDLGFGIFGKQEKQENKRVPKSKATTMEVDCLLMLQLFVAIVGLLSRLFYFLFVPLHESSISPWAVCEYLGTNHMTSFFVEHFISKGSKRVENTRDSCGLKWDGQYKSRKILKAISEKHRNHVVC